MAASEIDRNEASTAFEKSIEALGVSPKGETVVTGGWDFNCCGVWNVEAVFSKASKDKKCSKKRSAEEANTTSDSSILTVKPEFYLPTSAFQDCVSAVAFLGCEFRVLIGSLDGSARIYDLVSSAHLFALQIGTQGARAITAASYEPTALKTLALSHDDGRVSFWDGVFGQSSEASSLAARSSPEKFELSERFPPLLKQHKAKISGAAWIKSSTMNPFRLLTSGLDGAVKVSDSRSGKMALASVSLNGDLLAPRKKHATTLRVTSADVREVAQEEGLVAIVSGCSDGKVRLHVQKSALINSEDV